MRRNLSWAEIERRRKGRMALLLFTAGIGVLYVISSLFGDTGLIRHYHMRHAQHALHADLERLKLWNEILAFEIERLRNDPSHLEGLARTSLGMVKEGERVYILVDSP